MKKTIALAMLLTAACLTTLVVRIMFPRPPKLVRDLISPILRDRVHANPDSPNPSEVDLEERLDHLMTDNSPVADEASVILLDYYLGEHNGEAQICSVTRRGQRVMPFIMRYRAHRSGLVEPWYLTLRLNNHERNFMYETVVSAIHNGKILCD